MNERSISATPPPCAVELTFQTTRPSNSCLRELESLLELSPGFRARAGPGSAPARAAASAPPVAGASWPALRLVWTPSVGAGRGRTSTGHGAERISFEDTLPTSTWWWGP